MSADRIALDLAFDIPGSCYESDSHHYARRPYAGRCTRSLSRIAGSYWTAVGRLPSGFRLSVLEEIGADLDGLDHDAGVAESFYDAARAAGPVCEWTHLALRAVRPGGRLGDLRERDATGNVYYRVDLLTHEDVLAEGIRVPESRGHSVVEWNPALWLPAAVSDSVPGALSSRFYFDPLLDEAALMLRLPMARERFDLLALYPRFMELTASAYRGFEGTIEDVLERYTITEPSRL